MRITPTVILLILNIIVIGFIFRLEQKAADAASDNDKFVLGGDSLNLNRIAITRKNDTRIVLLKDGSQWRIEQPIHWLANNDALQYIIDQLRYMEKKVSFSVDEMVQSGRTLEEYGFDDPEAVLTLYSDSGVRTLQFGDSSTIGESVYVLDNDNKEIVAVAKEHMNSISFKLDDLRSQNIFNIPIFEIESLVIKSSEPELTIRLSRNNNKWAFESPIIAEADNDKISNVLNFLVSLKVMDFMDEDADATRYGLNNPAMRVTVRGNNRQEVLLLGDQAVSNESDIISQYAQVENSPTIFTTASILFEKLEKEWEKLRDRRIFNFNEDEITAFSVSTTNKDVELQKLETGPWQIVSRNEENNLINQPADEEVIKKLISGLSNFEAIDFISDAPSEEDLLSYGFNKPMLTIKLKGGKSTTFIIGSKVSDKNSYYAKLEKEETVYEISPIIFQMLSVNPLYYKDRNLYKIPETGIISTLRIKNLKSGESIFEAELSSAEKWSELLKKYSEDNANALSTALNLLRKFNVKHYIDASFDKSGFKADKLNEKISSKWMYLIETVVSLPGGDEVQQNSRNYYFTAIDDEVLGGSERDNYTFVPGDDMSEFITSLSEQKAIVPNEPIAEEK